ncbi:hypothetical protein HPB49_015084 [Dermacentor silvarum]|uniref:Uncharacterized protein n=1 Tax=Dermacentor silvarum TaxID=543639 RepID=A0ACB8CA37_DERSI|nr:hypothetical protein HPB49_015084 [Dermacentor silvarum]
MKHRSSAQIGSDEQRETTATVADGLFFTPCLQHSGQSASHTRFRGIRTSKPCGPDAFHAFYTALVLPTLEYCSSVWNPFQVRLTNMLESVQHRTNRTLFIRLGCGRDVLPRYEARLQR